MADVKVVTLVDRDGNECHVSTPVDVTNLVYGAGYRVKSHKNADEAAAFLAEKGPVAEQLALQQMDLNAPPAKGGKD